MQYHSIGAIAVVALASCIGEDVPVSGNSPDAGGEQSSSGGEQSSGGSSSSGGEQSSSGSSGTVCAERCDGDSLISCDDVRTTCAFGCRVAAGGARCKVFEPQGPASASDLLLGGLSDLTLNERHIIDVRTGEIRSESGPGLRQSNDTDGSAQIKNGVMFRIQEGVGSSSLITLHLPAICHSRGQKMT